MPRPTQSMGSLPVENSLDLLLLLLYSPGSSGEEAEPIAGVTRLQKLVFLLKSGLGPDALVEAAKDFKYQAYKMGPFSKDLYTDLDVLKSLGLIRTHQLEYLITDDSDSVEDTDAEHDLGDPLSDSPVAKSVVESTLFELTPRGIEIGKDLFSGLHRRDREALLSFKKFFNSISLRQLLIFVYKKFPEFTVESTIRGKLGF